MRKSQTATSRTRFSSGERAGNALAADDMLNNNIPEKKSI
jgi:hypothetical protein